jgi:hypothetical protein
MLRCSRYNPNFVLTLYGLFFRPVYHNFIPSIFFTFRFFFSSVLYCFCILFPFLFLLVFFIFLRLNLVSLFILLLYFSFPKLSLSGRTYFRRSCIRWIVLYRIAYWVLCPPILYSGSRIQPCFRSLPPGFAYAWALSHSPFFSFLFFVVIYGE